MRHFLKREYVTGAFILVVLLFLFFGGFDIARGVFGIIYLDEEDMMTLLYGGASLIALIWYRISKANYNRLTNTILDTYDPDEKLRLIDHAIKKTCHDPLRKTEKARELACAAKVGFLNLAANAYISKEDYDSALNRLAEARTLFAYLGEDQAVSNTLGVDEQCILTESVCLSRLGRVVEAERLVTPFMNRLGVMDDLSVALIMTARFEQAVSVNDVQTARMVVTYINPIYARLEKEYGQDIRTDYFLMDGTANLLEGFYEEGVQKLNYVINNTSNYSELQRARKLLSYSYSVSAAS